MSTTSEVMGGSEGPKPDTFTTEVTARFGMLPNFFCSATTAPGLIEEMWKFAKSAYLDSPLPSLFKERLFVHLSRFCEVRYCIIRHVGFLVGQGRPAGDASVSPQTVEDVIALLDRPLPSAEALNDALSRLEAHHAPRTIPDPGTQAEGDLLDALTVIFLEPRRSERARGAVRRAVGDAAFEILTAYLAFVRTAHYWTETHPELAVEADMHALMQQRDDLARLLLDTSEAELARSGQALRAALADLHHTKGSLRESEARFRTLLGAAPIAIFVCDKDAVIQYYNRRAVELWGREPALAVERHCGSARLWLPNGEVLPHGQSPIMDVLRTGNPVNAVELSIERPDGSRLPVLVDFAALKNEEGEITGVITCFQDISESKRAQRELIDSEQAIKIARDYAEATLRTSPIPLLVLEDNLRVHTANDAFYETFHVSREVTQGRLIYELGNGQWNIPKLRVLLEDILPHHSTFKEYEVTHDFESIGVRTMLLNARRMDNAPDVPPRIILVIEDTTERKKADEFNRSLMDGSADCIKVMDIEGRLLRMNAPGLCIMEIDDFGPLCGMDWSALWPEEQRQQIEDALAGARDGVPQSFQAFCPTAKNTPKWWDVSVSPVRDVAGGPIVRLLSVSRDITQQKRAEQALRLSEERFRSLADSMNQLAWMCDQLGDVTWYNQRWLDYTGLTFEEMKDWGWKQVQHPDHVDRVVASVTRSRESGEPWEDTFPLRGKDGEYRWFLSRAVPIKNEAGQAVRWLGTNTDITERRQAEEMQRLLTSELSHRVKNMLATVQAIATQTLRHSRDPSQFVSSFGGRIQSMSRVHSLLSDGDWQGADLRDVIRDQIHLGPIDEARVTARGPAVRLEAQAVPQVAMMLHELGTNSIKYGALSKAEGRVTIDWTVNDEIIKLQWVERGGPPVQAPAKRGFGTTLIEQSAKSVSGNAQLAIEAEGVSWAISLPLSRPQTGHVGALRRSGAANTSAVQGASSKGGLRLSLAGKRFLIVEDEPLVALDVMSSLQEAGVQPLGPVGSAQEALALIEGTALDAALLDANLHGQPVGDIAAALTRKGVPFAFVTGYGRDGLPEAFARADMLSKPFSQEQLLEAAAKLVHQPANVVKLRS